MASSGRTSFPKFLSVREWKEWLMPLSGSPATVPAPPSSPPTAVSASSSFQEVNFSSQYTTSNVSLRHHFAPSEGATAR